MSIHPTLRALASRPRLQILQWLKRPQAHFSAQVDGDLVKDGVCVVLIARKLGVSQPTATAHLRILAEAGLLRATRRRQWTFYRRDAAAIRATTRRIARDL